LTHSARSNAAWSLFERQHRVIVSAGMIACRGKVQREGDVIHVIADYAIDLSGRLRTIRERGEFSLPAWGRGQSQTSRQSRLPAPSRKLAPDLRHLHPGLT
jgi:error-prone DNA polymerase